MTLYNKNANFQYALEIDGLPYIWYKAPSEPALPDDIKLIKAANTDYPDSCWRRYRDTSNFVDYTSAVSNPVAQNTWVYFNPGGAAMIGRTKKFNQINMNYGLSNTFTGTVTYSYWDGSGWVVFTPTSDTTNSGTVDGAIVLPDLPAWEASAQESDSEEYFYIRIDIDTTGGTSYIASVSCTNYAVYKNVYSGLNDINLMGSTLNPSGCSFEGGQVNFSLVIKPGNKPKELLRIGARGADRYVQLTDSLEQLSGSLATSGSSVFAVDDNISSWPVTGTLHIGQEAIKYSNRLTASNEFVVEERGYLKTKIKSHKVDSYKSYYPRVQSDITNWPKRGARLYIQSPNSRVADQTQWIELVNGYIRQSPKINEDGLSIELSITPWTSALQEPLEAPGGSTALQKGYHVFDGQVGNICRMCYQQWEQGAAYNRIVRFDTAVGSTTINNCATAKHQDIFDPTASKLDKRGQIYLPTAEIVKPSGYYGSATDETGGFNITGPMPTSLSGNIDWVKNAKVTLPITASGWTTKTTYPDFPGVGYYPSQSVAWPGDAINAINSQWTPGTTQGDDGLWADMSVIPFDSNFNSPMLQLYANFESSEDSMDFKLTLKPEDLGAQYFYPYGDGRRIDNAGQEDEQLYTLWYGFSMDDPDNPTTVRIDRRTRELVAWSRDNFKLDSRASTDGKYPTNFKIKGFADAFYQMGEKFILVEEDIFPANYPFFITVKYKEDGQDNVSVIRITNKEEASIHFPGTPGVMLTVDYDYRWSTQSFGAWSNKDEPVIYYWPHWKRELPWVIILELLLSSEGGQFESIYDILPFGLGLSEDEVDIDSFTNISLPAGAVSEVDDLYLTDETNIIDFISSILKLNGMAIIPKRVGTKRKLALVTVNPTCSKEFKGVIGNGDWDPKNRPFSYNFEKQIINVIDVNCNGDYEGNSNLSIRLEDNPSIQEQGSSKVESIDAPWLQLSPLNAAEQKEALYPASQNRFILFGSPRREYSGVVAYSGKVALLNVGDVVLVTANNILDNKGNIGVSSAPMKILEIEPNLEDNTSSITLSYYDLNLTGWAPAALGSAIISTTAIAFEDNQYSDADLDIKDAEYFVAGDEIRLCPKGDYGNSVTLIIDSISGSSVTFTTAHGFVAADILTGLTMRIIEYNSASTEQKTYAYLCDSNGTLGSDNDPGFEYA